MTLVTGFIVENFRLVEAVGEFGYRVL